MNGRSLSARFDSADRYFITTELQSIDPQKYYHLVPGSPGRRYLPPVAGASPNLPVYKWIATTLLGKSRVSRGHSKDAPSVQVKREEKTHSIKAFEAEMTWSIDEVRAAAEAKSNGHQNVDFVQDQLVSAMTKLEQDVDSALAVGISSSNATGFANNPDIDHTNMTGDWPSLTPDQIIGDARKLIQEAISALKQAQVPGSDMPMFQQFVLFVPLAWYSHIDMTPYALSTGPVLSKSVREFIGSWSAIAKVNGEPAIRPWWRLDEADDGDPIAVLAPALDNGAVNPLAGGALIPGTFEREPEQYTGRNVTVPCARKCGGFAVRYPVAFRYGKQP